MPTDARLRDAIATVRWSAGPDGAGNAALRAVAVHFAEATTLPVAEEAARVLLSDAGWIAALLESSAGGMRDAPAFGRDGHGANPGVVLAETAVARVTMDVIENRPSPANVLPDRIVVGGRVSWTRYLRGGGARLWRWRSEPVDDRWHAGIAAPARPLAVQPLTDGALVRVDGRQDAMLLVDPTADVVAVTVTLRPGAAAILREYDRVGGTLVAVVPLDDGAVRGIPIDEPFEPARQDATRGGSADDARTMQRRLRAMADDPHPGIRITARALLPLIDAQAAGGGPARGGRASIEFDPVRTGLS